MKMDQTEKLILEAIDQHRDEIIEFARDIYDHGELGYKEFNTAEKFIKKMKELGVEPGDIKGIEDIVKLPFTTKEDLRNNYPFGLRAVRNCTCTGNFRNNR